MIDKELLIKKLKEEIKDNKDISMALELELEKQKSKIRPDENFIMSTMHILICNKVEINIYKDLIKRIKKGEFDKKTSEIKLIKK